MPKRITCTIYYMFEAVGEVFTEEPFDKVEYLVTSDDPAAFRGVENLANDVFMYSDIKISTAEPVIYVVMLSIMTAHWSYWSAGWADESEKHAYKNKIKRALTTDRRQLARVQAAGKDDEANTKAANIRHLENLLAQL